MSYHYSFILIIHHYFSILYCQHTHTHILSAHLPTARPPLLCTTMVDTIIAVDWHAPDGTDPALLNMKVLHDFIISTIGEVTKVKRLHNKAIRVWVQDQDVAQNALAVENINGIPMKAVIPPELHISRGVILSTEIPILTDEDLELFLQLHKPWRIFRRLQNAPGAVVDFFGLQLPPTVKIGWETVTTLH